MSVFNPFRKRSSQPTPSSASETPAAPESEVAAGGETSSEQGFLARLRQGLKRTGQLLNTDIRDLFKQEGRLVDDQFLTELFAALVKTDMGGGPAGAIRDEIKREYRARVVTVDELLSAVRAKILELLAQEEAPLKLAPEGTTVIMVVGVNGSGKTTSIAKLAYLLKQQGHKVVLGAGDTFRAAAVEQLSIWAERLGVEIVKGPQGSDPASIAHQAVELAQKSGADVCIVDTAGRLQTQVNLMQQLSKIRRVMSRLIPDAPHEVILVLDATAGQNGISQARGFSEAAGCTGIVLAKLDGTAKGGVVIPIRQQFNLPVKFIGVGEKPEDLAPFDPQQFVQALFAETR